MCTSIAAHKEAMSSIPLATRFDELQRQVQGLEEGSSQGRDPRRARDFGRARMGGRASLLIKLVKAGVNVGRAPPGHQENIIQNMLDARAEK